MSLTSDVREELARLDGSPRALRRFGLTLAAVLAAAAAWLALRRHAPQAALAAGGLAGLLAGAGALAPAALRLPHRAWMTLALAMGWVTSRVVLTLLFALAVTPVALLARLVGKRFLETEADPALESYWTPRRPGAGTSYQKMF